jgi:hypothetical protein
MQLASRACAQDASHWALRGCGLTPIDAIDEERKDAITSSGEILAVIHF